MFRRRTYEEPDHPARTDVHETSTEPDDPVATEDIARPIVSMVAALIVIALLVVEILLVGRLGFQLGEANPQNNFVEFVYDVSGPLLEPFSGIMDVEALDSGGIFDPNILIAMSVYLVAGLLALAVLWALASPLLQRRNDGASYETYDTRRMHQH